MQTVNIAGHRIYIKRDDLLNKHFSGNKARKFAYFMDNDFTTINKIIGYGSPQANSLLSLAALANLKGWQLDFYVKNIPNWLKNNANGNYKAALALNANIIEIDNNELNNYKNLDHFMKTKKKTLHSDSLFIPEGGRCQYAQHGIQTLANEIIEFCQSQGINDPLIMLPSGTGTTAIFLQSFLPFQVYTCACVGTADYLRAQFSELDSAEMHWPTILTTTKKYHFGKLYKEFYDIWLQLQCDTQIEFDLLYDPLGWITLLEYLTINSDDKPVIYIHQGGIVGNESMLPRYKRKFPDYKPS